MPLRSMLFVPSDNESNLAGATRFGADALLLDLEDSVSPARKAVARTMCADYLLNKSQPRTPLLYVRINALPLPEAWEDVAAVMPCRPDGIMLPKSEPAFLEQLDRRLTELERHYGYPEQSTAVIPIATETPRGMFTIGNYGGVAKRLRALTWGGEDLAADLGAVNRRADGEYEDTFRLARSLCVLGAGAAGVDALDAAFMNYADLDAFERECRSARRAGYVGKLAIHPRQVASINTIFTPSDAEVEWARRVVAAFTSQPSLGVVGIDGKVVDRPHLRLAERLLARL